MTRVSGVDGKGRMRKKREKFGVTTAPGKGPDLVLLFQYNMKF